MFNSRKFRGQRYNVQPKTASPARPVVSGVEVIIIAIALGSGAYILVLVLIPYLMQ